MSPIVALLFATLSVCSLFELNYQPNHEYIFDYNFKVIQSDEQTNSFVSLDALVDLIHVDQDKETGLNMFYMNMKNVQVLSNGTLSSTVQDSYQQTISQYPLAFTTDNFGSIQETFYMPQDPQWSVNLKKGVLKAMNLNQEQQTDLKGNDLCAYSFVPSETLDYKIIKKFKDEKCNPELSVDDIDVFGSQESQFFISKLSGILERVFFSSENVFPVTLDFQIVSQGAGSLILKEKRPVKLPENLETVQALKNYITGKFEFSNTEMIQDDLTLHEEIEVELDDDNKSSFASDEKVKLALDLAQTIEKNPAGTSQFFLQLIKLVKENIKIILPLQGYLKSQPVLVDAFIASGIDQAFDAVLNSLNDVPFEYLQDDSLLIQLLQKLAYRPGTKRTFEFVYNLATDNGFSETIRQTAVLSLGAMIHTTIESDKKTAAWVNKYLKFLEDQLKSADNEQKMLLFIHALGNAGQVSSAQLLNAIILNPGLCEKVLQAALLALRRMNRGLDFDTRQLLLNVFLLNPKQELKLTAFENLLSELNLEEAKKILTFLNEETVDSTIKDKVITSLLSIAQTRGLFGIYLGGLLDYHGFASEKSFQPKLQFSSPVFSRKDERLIVGNPQMGAYAGYDITVLNPLFPDGQERTIANSKFYSFAHAFNKKFEIFTGLFNLRGDMIPLTGKHKPIESYFYYSVGGVFWNQCIDLVGNACKKLPPPDQEPVCYNRKIQLMQGNFVLHRFSQKIPLIYGIFLDLKIQFGSFIQLAAKGEGCSRPYTGTIQFLPVIGLDVSGESEVNAYMVRAGARLSAKLLYSDLPVTSTLDLSQKPFSLCSHMAISTRSVSASIAAYFQTRSEVKWCQVKERKVPCWVKWGPEYKIERSWNEYHNQTMFERDLVKYCVQFDKPKNFEMIEMK